MFLLVVELDICKCHSGPGPLGIHFCPDLCAIVAPHPEGPDYEHIWNECNCTTEYAAETDCNEGEGCDEDGTQSSSGTGGSASDNEGNKSIGGATVKSNWWMYVMGAVAVGMVGAAIIMRKRVRW